MDGRSILIVHLVELVNKADTFVSENQSSSFQDPFLRYWISVNTSSETYCTCTLASCVNNSWEDLLDVLEEL